MHGVAALWAVNPNLPTDLAHAVGDLTQDAVLTGLTAALPTEDVQVGRRGADLDIGVRRGRTDRGS